MAGAANQGPWYRLEFAAVTRRKCGGITGYGFALFENHSNHLVATGCGPVTDSVSFNQATHLALLEGLRVAHSLGVSSQLLLQTDSRPAIRQLERLTGPERLPAAGNVVLAEVAAALEAAGGEGVHLQQVDRWANGMAIVQAEFATELRMLLPKVGSCPPSKYAHMAGHIGSLLLLPMPVRRVMEAADSFADTAAEMVALRCGTRKEDLLTVINNTKAPAAVAAHTAEDSSSSTTAHASSSDSSSDSSSSSTSSAVEQLVPIWSPFTMRRVFTQQEGAAYAAAAAAAVEAEGSDDLDSSSSSAGGDAVAGKPHKLVGGRVVGRHRLNNRYLVVGFHSIPANWEPGQPIVQQQQERHVPAADRTVDQQQQRIPLQNEQQPTSLTAIAEAAEAAPAPAPNTAMQAPDSSAAAAAAAASGGASVADVLLPAWKVHSGAASSSEAVGLGTGRYSLPHVTSDTATHLLQFDGASRNNPGRGGYGYVIFDLTSGQLIERGCMSLPYGQTAGQAEFEGLLAGLSAALAAGIRALAVQGDSALVLDAIMYRRGIGSQATAISYHKASQLLAQFDHVDFQFVPREQNSMADRLANMSMDIDTALYALLRKDERGVAGLKVVTKAARMAKRLDGLQQLLQQYEFPLLLVVLLQRVMAIRPHQLLQRLQDKALRLGDPNPWLVQEVRKLAEAGVPQALADKVGAAVMDTRYTTAGTRSAWRGAAAQRQQLQQQQLAPSAAAREGHGQTQQTRQYSVLSSAAAAAADVSISIHGGLPHIPLSRPSQQTRQYSLPCAAADAVPSTAVLPASTLLPHQCLDRCVLAARGSLHSWADRGQQQWQGLDRQSRLGGVQVCMQPAQQAQPTAKYAFYSSSSRSSASGDRNRLMTTPKSGAGSRWLANKSIYIGSGSNGGMYMLGARRLQGGSIKRRLADSAERRLAAAQQQHLAFISSTCSSSSVGRWACWALAKLRVL